MYRRFPFCVCVLLVLGALVARAQAAPSAAGTFGYTRYMLVSGKYFDLAIEVDGRRVHQQPANTLGSYVALPSDRGHTLRFVGRRLGIPNGEEEIRTIKDFRPAAGSSGMEIFTDDGIAIGLSDEPPPPPGKSRLHLITADLGQAIELRFGTKTLALNPSGEISASHVVEPSTALLEVRKASSGKVLRSQFLRAQPGFRYEVVMSRTGPRDEEFVLHVVAVSPQLMARPTETRVFGETGHLLEGRLREYWDGTGGLPVFGFPLNDDHLERTADGAFITQVFERNRFEYHPAKTAPYDVLLGRLGDERLRQLGRDWRAEWKAAPADAACATMTTDNRVFQICEPFRSYYAAHGLEFDGQAGFSRAESLAFFGLPLTQARAETTSSGDRVMTQWFERARFEYHPANPRGQQVLLGRLGAEVYGLEPFTFDDEDRGFSRSSAPGAPDWNEASGGFGGHYWWTCAENLGAIQSAGGNLRARWTGPRVQGTYELQIFVPDNHANSRNVNYLQRVGFDEGVVAPLDQQPHANVWVPLNTLELQSEVHVTAYSNTGEPGGCRTQLAVDAIRLVPKP